MDMKKLNLARNKIDIIDKELFKLIKKRTQIVKYMLSLKKYKKQIIDHRRINIILKKMRIKSLQNNIDPRITNKIWKAIIWSYVDYQKRNFKRK